MIQQGSAALESPGMCRKLQVPQALIICHSFELIRALDSLRGNRKGCVGRS